MESPFARPPPPPFQHPVGAGETLRALASRFALPAEELARANQLPLEALLRPGQRVRIPGFVCLPVTAADTLYGLRQRTGLSAGAIARYNALADERELAFRKVLAIPAPRKQRSPVTRVRVRPPKGLVVVTRGDRETTLATGAREAALVGEGAYVVWVSGGSRLKLTVYDSEKGKLRLLLDGMRELGEVQSARLRDGRVVLWVQGVEAGTGEPVLSVLDPQRGEIYRQEHTEVVSRAGDVLRIRAREARRSSAPFRVRTLDLGAL